MYVCMYIYIYTCTYIIYMVVLIWGFRITTGRSGSPSIPRAEPQELPKQTHRGPVRVDGLSRAWAAWNLVSHWEGFCPKYHGFLPWLLPQMLGIQHGFLPWVFCQMLAKIFGREKNEWYWHDLHCFKRHMTICIKWNVANVFFAPEHCTVDASNPMMIWLRHP